MANIKHVANDLIVSVVAAVGLGAVLLPGQEVEHLIRYLVVAKEGL
ncbi:MAG: hypothetical protein AAGE92_12990 [Cyanobacteria bacterium P01_G01_bin.4]